MSASTLPRNRRRWGPPALLLFLATAAALAGCGRAEPEPDPLARSGARHDPAAPPVTYSNLVLIVVDTLASRHLPSYGYSRDTAPFLTKLANEGIQFQGYSASSWTRSSMATLLTGLYPQRHRAVGRDHALPPGVPFLPELLSENGIHTAAYVTNGNVGADFGFDRGYEQFIGFVGDFKPPASWVRGKVAKMLPTLRPPFFLYVHLIDPHDPYFPEHAWDDDPPTRADYIQPQAFNKGEKPSPAAIERMRNQYDGEIREMDRALEVMLADLDRHGLLKETLVGFTADHGEEFDEHGGLAHGRTLYDEVIAVPFILWNLKPPMQPRISTEPFDQVHFLPTVLEALGLPEPPGIDGTSQWSAIAAGGPVGERDVFSHLDLDTNRSIAIQSGDFKLILASSDPAGQLFDRRRDPHELVSLPASAGPGGELAARLRRTHADLASRGYTAPKAEVSDETLKQLKALGYIQ
jgi:arylsulfatase A-like enzyme